MLKEMAQHAAQYHEIVCTVTQEEYERMRRQYEEAGDEAPGNPPMLFALSEVNEAIFEDDLPSVVRTLLIAHLNIQDSDAAADMENWTFDTASLPFEIRAALMEAASRHWTPGTPEDEETCCDGSCEDPGCSGPAMLDDDSGWHGPREEATNLVERYPVLMSLGPPIFKLR